MIAAYRSLEPAAAERAAIAQALWDEQASHAGPMVRIFARRAARAWGGRALALGGLAMFACALADVLAKGHAFWNASSDLPTWVLAASWPAAAIAYLLARIGYAGWAKWHLGSLQRAVHADPLADHARGPDDLLRDWSMSLERASVGWPLVGLALVAPLTIHGLFVEVVSWINDTTTSTRDYAEWIGTSTVLVGHAHLVLALCSWRYANKLRIRGRDELGSAGVSGMAALGWTTLAGALPGALLMLIPPALVFITGLLFVPASFAVMTGRARDERLALSY
jgi:hypothetical protein